MPSWSLVGAWLSLGVVPQQDIGFEELTKALLDHFGVYKE